MAVTGSPKVAAQESKCCKPCVSRSLRLEIPLHRVHLRHRVGHRCAGGEHDAAAAIPLLDIADLQEHIEGPLRRCLRQAGDAGHFGDVEEILEIVGLVDEQAVDAKLLEGERVVLLMLGRKSFKPGLEPVLGRFQLFDEPGETLVASSVENQVLQVRRFAL